MDFGALSATLNLFINQAAAGAGVAMGYAQNWLFWLTLIELVVIGSTMMFAGGPGSMELMIWRLLRIGIVVALVNNYDFIAMQLMRSFIIIGIEAGGSQIAESTILNPSLLLNELFRLVTPAFTFATQISIFSPSQMGTALVYIIAGMLTIFAGAIGVLQIFIVSVTFYVSVCAGIILVPFAVNDRTEWLAQGAIRMIVVTSLRLLILAFLISMILPVMQAQTLDVDPPLSQVLSLPVFAVVMVGLLWFAPSIADGVGSGSPSLSLGAIVGGGVSAMLVSSMALRAGGGAMGSVTGMIGSGAQALGIGGGSSGGSKGQGTPATPTIQPAQVAAGFRAAQSSGRIGQP